MVRDGNFADSLQDTLSLFPPALGCTNSAKDILRERKTSRR